MHNILIVFIYFIWPGKYTYILCWLEDYFMMIQKYLDWNLNFWAYIIILNYFIFIWTGTYTYIFILIGRLFYDDAKVSRLEFTFLSIHDNINLNILSLSGLENIYIYVDWKYQFNMIYVKVSELDFPFLSIHDNLK